MFADIDLTLDAPNIELFLAKPDKKIIAKLTESYNKKMVLKLGNINELTFTLPYEVDINRELVRNDHVDMIRDRYLIKAVYGDKSEWYIVTNIADVMDATDSMNVTCYLLPFEMGSKNLRIFKEDALNIYQVMNGDTIVNTEAGTTYVVYGILETTRWKLGYVDGDIATKYRGYDLSSTNVLDAIFKVADTLMALIIFDTDTRTINFYNADNYGINRGLTINYGHYLQSLNKEIHGDEVVTRLKVFGKDSISIQGVNLTGQNYLEDYSYFMYPFQRDANRNVIAHSAYMTDELCHAILDYTEFLQSKNGQFQTLLDQRKVYEASLTQKNIEYSILIEQLLIIQNNIDLANSTGEDSSVYVTQKTAKTTEIANKQTEINGVLSSIDTIDNQILILRTSFSYNQFFTDELVDELKDYIYEKEFANDSYTDENDLYADAVIEFNKVKQPQIIVNVNIVDFMKIVVAQRDWGKLNLGDTIIISYDKINVNITAKIIEISIDDEGGSINLTIANTKDILTDDEKLIKMLYASSVATSTIDMSKSKWDGIEGTKSQVEQFINNTWSTIKTGIEGGINNTVTFNERGILVRNTTDPNTYLVIQNGVLAITNDNGNTWKHAITKDGIIAERIFGKLIAGVNLIIDASDSQGVKTFTVNSTGVTILGSALTITGGLTSDNLDPAFVAQIDDDIAQVQIAVNSLESDVLDMISDGNITAIEANTLKISLAQVASESVDILATATTLGITTSEKTNYSSSLATLTTEINKWIDQASYPIAVTTTDRTNIKNKFSDLQSKKSILINKIIAVREQRAKDASVALGIPYNGVVIDSVNGLVITKSDNTIRTSLNATDGFKFQKKVASSWEDMLYYNATTGNLTVNGEINAKALKINGDDVLTSGGKLKALAIETLTVGENVIMGANAKISWTNVTSQPFIPTVPSYIEATQITGAYIASPNIFGGTITIGSLNNVFKADSNGVYLGNASFASAPFSVSMFGNLKATNATITGTITGSTITGGTITGATITGSTVKSRTTSTGAGVELKSNFGDIAVYNQNNQMIFNVYDNIDGTVTIINPTSTMFFGNSTSLSVPKGAWDFSEAQVTGFTAVFG